MGSTSKKATRWIEAVKIPKSALADTTLDDVFGWGGQDRN